MSPNTFPLPSLSLLLPLLLLSSFYLLTPISTLPDPEPETVQPFKTTQPPSSTIPAFPEQSNIVGCPLNLPDEFFHGVKSACGGRNTIPDELHKSRCCPVLASWLYFSYSATALGGAGRLSTASVDMPLLPDDSETCVDELGKSLRGKGIELFKANESCDVVYCYCGIRLHPLSCPEAFVVSENGNVVGDKRVKRLEKDCYGLSGDVNGFPGLGGCNKCLNSLHSLNHNNKTSNSSKLQDRATKMRNQDCQLMGLTWLLANNRMAYFRTVTSVLRALMMSKDGSYPRSCTLNSDGMPLAVDSSEFSSNTLSVKHNQPSVFASIALFTLLYMFFCRKADFLMVE